MDELIKSNFIFLHVALWLFGGIYLIWIIFDYYLLPEHWLNFLYIRLGVTGTTYFLNFLTLFKSKRKYILNFFVFVCVAFEVGIAYMLPLSNEMLLPYVMGFSLPIVAATVAPVWHPARLAIIILSAFVSALLSFLILPFNGRLLDIIASIFYFGSISIACPIGAYLRYYTAKKEFIARLKIEELILKEDQKNEMANQIRNVSERTGQITINLGEAAQKSSQDLAKINVNIDGMQNRIVNLNQNIFSSVQSSQDINGFIKEVAALILVQKDFIMKSSAAVESISQAVQAVAALTREKREVALDLEKLAAQGNIEMSKTIALIKSTAKSTANISEMLAAINDVAEKTDVLSINASIEAVHAGQFGKGFAVVAAEVRKLAEESTRNAVEIGKSLNDIIKAVKNSEQTVDKTGQLFQHITEKTKDVSADMLNIDKELQALSQESKSIQSDLEELTGISDKVSTYSSEMERKMNAITSAIEALNQLSHDTKLQTEAIVRSIEQLTGAINNISGIGQENRKSLNDLENLLQRFQE